MSKENERIKTIITGVAADNTCVYRPYVDDSNKYTIEIIPAYVYPNTVLGVYKFENRTRSIETLREFTTYDKESIKVDIDNSTYIFIQMHPNEKRSSTEFTVVARPYQEEHSSFSTTDFVIIFPIV